jgi:UDP-GlcNAc3NAcA epimerase
VAHVEAGLRSFNRRMPEEINRILTDHVAELLFAPTDTAMRNLAHEGLEAASRFTGDVMFDSVLFYREMVTADPDRYRLSGIPSSYLLATVHRAENTDHPAILAGILSAFGQTGRPVVLPLHPRTRKMLEQSSAIPANVQVIEPVGYLEMLRLTLDAEKVMTDSGGLQKEAYFLEKPCITLRTETEWTETLHDHWNTVTGTDPDRILAAVKLPAPQAPQRPSFGNGNAASEILSLLTKF